MRAFLREELARFLDAVDGALAGPIEVIVIGGSAAALHYGVTRATHDIDTWTTVQTELAAAAERARALTGLEAVATLIEDASCSGTPRASGACTGTAARSWPAACGGRSERACAARP